MGLGSGPAWVLCFVRTCICYSVCVHSGTHIPVVFEVKLPALGNSSVFFVYLSISDEKPCNQPGVILWADVTLYQR